MTCGYLEKRYSRGAGFDKCVTAHLDPHTNGLGFYAFILFNYFDKKKI
jgi:phosphatidylglycerophosphatase A